MSPYEERVAATNGNPLEDCLASWQDTFEDKPSFTHNQGGKRPGIYRVDRWLIVQEWRS